MPQMDCAARPMTWQSLGNHLLLVINLSLLLLASGLRLLVLNDSPRGKVLLLLLLCCLELLAKVSGGKQWGLMMGWSEEELVGNICCRRAKIIFSN
jgi:hypothetical protein